MMMEPDGRGIPPAKSPAPVRQRSEAASTRIHPDPNQAEASASDRPVGRDDLQILTTEHWGLLATRSLTWSEAFSRAQMFLSVLSAAVVALALVAQAADFGDGFVAFALVVLPVVLFLGVTTFVRLVAVNADEGRWVVGMNRLRSAYLEVAPHLERYFVTGHHDDLRGVMVTGGWGEFPTLGGFVTTSAVVSVISSVVAGVIVFLAAQWFGIDIRVGLAAAALVSLVGVVAANRYEARSLRRAGSRLRPIDPTP